MSLINEIRAELGSAHLRQQAGRVARITALALAAQVAALGTAHLDRSTLVAAGVAVAEAVYRQIVPVAGWGSLAQALASRLHLLGGQAATVAAPSAAPAAVAPTGAIPAPADGSGPASGV